MLASNTDHTQHHKQEGYLKDEDGGQMWRTPYQQLHGDSSDDGDDDDGKTHMQNFCILYKNTSCYSNLQSQISNYSSILLC